jgi:hypothetical protein
MMYTRESVASRPLPFASRRVVAPGWWNSKCSSTPDAGITSGAIASSPVSGAASSASEVGRLAVKGGIRAVGVTASMSLSRNVSPVHNDAM